MQQKQKHKTSYIRPIFFSLFLHELRIISYPNIWLGTLASLLSPPAATHSLFQISGMLSSSLIIFILPLPMLNTKNTVIRKKTINKPKNHVFRFIELKLYLHFRLFFFIRREKFSWLKAEHIANHVSRENLKFSVEVADIAVIEPPGGHNFIFGVGKLAL